ncbi:hypothetical protein [Paenibacillus sp. 1A_MP2]|uniref:hypothetical protein n=1 Tax=Paenibacillus sp. 1A_MP2 TaxID=3457495 RepID=UPI003FCCE610
MTKVEKIYLQEKEQALKEQACDFAKKMLKDLDPDKGAEITGLPLKGLRVNPKASFYLHSLFWR